MRRCTSNVAWLVVVCLWVKPVVGQTAQLETAGEVLGALKAGQRVRVVLRYKEMSLVDEKGQPQKAPDATGAMDLDTFEYFAAGSIGNPEGYLATSQTHLIRHPRHGYVLNYVKLSLYDGGTVKIVAQYLSPATYEVKMDETFTTTVAGGTKGGAAWFYVAKLP